jgi:hypothetical protein
MTADAPQSTGSAVADAFLVATAAELAAGAGDAVKRVAERHEDPDADPRFERRRAELLAERAAFTWAVQIQRAADPAVAGALTGLRTGQASYAAVRIEEYAQNVPAGSARKCLTESARALREAATLGDQPSEAQLISVATHSGGSLAACHLAEGVLGVPDEAASTVDQLLEVPVPMTIIAWE